MGSLLEGLSSSDRLALLALFVFGSHLPFFAWRWWRTRETRYAATSLTFSLLVLAYSLRLFVPDLRVCEVELHEICRRVAWVSAVFGISMLVAHHLRSDS